MMAPWEFGTRSLLICLQGRDAAGKDGTINHVLGAMNPQGCNVTGFKVPSKEEAAHDFLWRYHQHTPGKGQVAIFNRSHYEDALGKCSTEHAPWFVIPSNHNWFRNLTISRIVSETLESLDMKFPEPTVDIDEIKKKYHAIVEQEGDAPEAELEIQPEGGKGKKSKKGKKGNKRK